MRVLLAEADAPATRSVLLLLRTLGAVTDTATSGEEALDLVRHYEYDMLLLNLALPDIDGIDIIKRMRAARIDTPIITIANAARTCAKLHSLSAGADDCVTRPYDDAEFLARIQAVNRRSKGFSQPVAKMGPVEINLNSREVKINGAPLHLTGKEYAIFELLFIRKGAVLTKEVFLNHLYGGMDEPEMKIIDVFICKLRRKLGNAGAPGLITTVWGRGYMMRDAGAEKLQPFRDIVAVPALRETRELSRAQV